MTDTTTARTYEWGIESSAGSEAGCIAARDAGTATPQRYSLTAHPIV